MTVFAVPFKMIIMVALAARPKMGSVAIDGVNTGFTYGIIGGEGGRKRL